MASQATFYGRPSTRVYRASSAAIAAALAAQGRTHTHTHMRALCLAAALLHGADGFASFGGIPQVIFAHDAVLDDFLGEALVMEAHNKGEINLLGAAAGNPHSMRDRER